MKAVGRRNKKGYIYGMGALEDFHAFIYHGYLIFITTLAGKATLDHVAPKQIDATKHPVSK